jgi:hypothetical protein
MKIVCSITRIGGISGERIYVRRIKSIRPRYAEPFFPMLEESQVEDVLRVVNNKILDDAMFVLQNSGFKWEHYVAVVEYSDGKIQKLTPITIKDAKDMIHA